MIIWISRTVFACAPRRIVVATQMAELNPTSPPPVRSDFNPAAAIDDLIGRLRASASPFRHELEAIVQGAEGVTLASASDLKTFKESFTLACQLLETGPLLPSGRVGSLQVAGAYRDKIWTTISAAGETVGTGAPANTIPRMSLG